MHPNATERRWTRSGGNPHRGPQRQDAADEEQAVAQDGVPADSWCELRAAGSAEQDEWQARSVVEDVPADGTPALLIVENEFTDSGRQLHPLPPPLLGPSLRSVHSWDRCTGRPDGVRGSAQVMGGDVRHRSRLARRQCSELRWIGHPPRRRIRLEGFPTRVTHPHLTTNPASTGIDSVARPAIPGLMILEQMQHVLGAQEGPVS